MPVEDTKSFLTGYRTGRMTSALSERPTISQLLGLGFFQRRGYTVSDPSHVSDGQLTLVLAEARPVAVNQVSLTFYAPRWKQRLTTYPTARTFSGEPLQIADAVPAADEDAPFVQTGSIVGWLADQGFMPANWGRGSLFERGQVKSLFGLEKEIEVSVGDEAGEVTDLYCRFTLPRDTPPPLSEWAEFVSQLCKRFHLRLGADGIAPCGEAEFMAAVKDNFNYRDFAASFSRDRPDV
jgi:hypothetical protein